LAFIASEGGAVVSINTATFEPYRFHALFCGPIFKVAVTPDSTRLLFRCDDHVGFVIVGPEPLSAGFLYVPPGSLTDYAITPDGTRAYISVASADGAADSVLVVDATNLEPGLLTVIATIPVTRRPYGMAMTPDGSRLYVLHELDSTVSVISTATNAVVATIPSTSPRAVAISADGTRAYVGGPGNLDVIDTGSNTQVGTIPLSWKPQFRVDSMAITPDGTRLYLGVVDQSSPGGAVLVVNTATGQLTSGGFDLASATTVPGIAFTPDGQHVWVIYNSGMQSALQIRQTGTGLLVKIIEGGGSAQGIVIPPPRVPVTISSSLAGRAFSVSGTACPPGTYVTPQTLPWKPDASCTVSFASAQAGAAGTQYVFTEWADGATTASHTIATPAAATTYTANFKTQYQLTAMASPAGSGTITGASYYDAGASASISATPAGGYQFLTWTGPVASASSPSTTVTMSAPVSVTGNFGLLTTVSVPNVSAQYSDPVTLSAIVGPAGAVFTGAIQFQVNGMNAGPAIPVTGAGTYTTTWTVGLAAGPHIITAALTPSTPIASGSSGAGALTVNWEDATITPSDTNPAAVAVSAPGGVVNAITFGGTLQQAADGKLGNLTLANATVTLIPALAGGSNISCPATISGSTLTATCPNVPVDAYTARWQVTGDYYTSPAVNTVLAVYDPSLGFVTGSGSVMRGGVPADFALSLKYNKDGAVQGGLTYVERRAGGDVVAASTSVTSMSIVDTSAVIFGNATVNGVGGYTLRATITDNGSPGVNRDLFGLEMSGNPDAGVAFPPVAIADGNIQLH
jgi:YVTN family beta-propeller protein